MFDETTERGGVAKIGALRKHVRVGDGGLVGVPSGLAPRRAEPGAPPSPTVKVTGVSAERSEGSRADAPAGVAQRQPPASFVSRTLMSRHSPSA